MRKCSAVFKIWIIFAGVLGILLQCGLGSGEMSLESFVMFTTLSNVAVIVYYVCHLILCRQHKNAPECLVRWKFLITLSIMLTGLVAHFMLRHIFDALPAMQRYGLTLLHYVVPTSVLLDWLLFDEKGHTRAWMPLFAAIFPLSYLAAAMILVAGLGIGDYPYPFLDIDTLGLGTVLLIILGLCAAFITVGYLGYRLDHCLAAHEA